MAGEEEKRNTAKVDLVYIYGRGYSKFREQEIVFSLRSVEKFVSNYRRVFIVGDFPQTLNTLATHIPHIENTFHCKERRIMNKLLTVCSIPEISDDFLLYNDDYYHTKPFDAAAVPYYYDCEIIKKIQRRPKDDLYKASMKNTSAVLKNWGIERALYFDIHYPMYYNKKLFPQIMDLVDWEVRGGYVIKSLYANIAGVPPVHRKDYKIKNITNKHQLREIFNEADLFSTDEIPRNLVSLLNEYYMTKSRFEN